MKIGIVGAGMAGLSCAEGLSSVGHRVILVDKGRGPGGRMSTRRVETELGPIAFDHGAQYFTARDQGFRRKVEHWAAQGCAEIWSVLPTEDVWVGTPTMSNVVNIMAIPHTIHWGCAVKHIEKTQSGWLLGTNVQDLCDFDAIVLAIPAEQATPFLALFDFEMARLSMLARSQPCWTGMFAFTEKLPSARDFIRDAGIVGWAARNNAKPGHGGHESWVVQATGDWSQSHIEDEAPDVAHALLNALSDALGSPLPAPVAANAHRWRYAMSAGLGVGAMWNGAIGLGVCGDWLLGPRVECAWLSGQQLARQMVEAPPVDASERLA